MPWSIGVATWLSSQIPGDGGLPILPLALSGAGSESQRAGRPRHESILALFEELRPPVLRYLLNRKLPMQRAEEIVQEVFLELFRNERKGRTIDQPRAWIFGVAHNMAMREHRSMRRESPHITQVESESDAALAVADSRPTPEAALADRQRDIRLREAMAQLSDIERQCLDLRAEGLSYREIAEVIGSATSTIGDHVRRAISILRRACEI
jgi:RNA polymerase sigma-70 factor (ECF subfamily)